MTVPSAGIRQTLFLLVLVHVLLAVQRLPGKVYKRRAEQLGRMQEEGLVDFFLSRDPQASKSVQWLLDNTAPDSVILIRGHWQGTLEVANALLYPRMLYSEPAAPAAASHLHGRPIARGAPDGVGAGVLVLVDDGETLRLSLR